MYVPAHFAPPDDNAVLQFIAEHPLAALITADSDGHISISHAPLYLDGQTLRGHLARANPHVRLPIEEREAVALFQGPDYYVSPAWYPSKRENPRVVPTWNYIAVEARGPLRFVDDPAWLRETVTRLTEIHEGGRPEPWTLTDAPADFLNGMLKAIVGVEITVARFEGKWKMSQNRSEQDRVSVMHHAAAPENRKGPREEGPSENGAEDRT